MKVSIPRTNLRSVLFHTESVPAFHAAVAAPRRSSARLVVPDHATVFGDSYSYYEFLLPREVYSNQNIRE